MANDSRPASDLHAGRPTTACSRGQANILLCTGACVYLSLPESGGFNYNIRRQFRRRRRSSNGLEKRQPPPRPPRQVDIVQRRTLASLGERWRHFPPLPGAGCALVSRPAGHGALAWPEARTAALFFHHSPQDSQCARKMSLLFVRCLAVWLGSCSSQTSWRRRRRRRKFYHLSERRRRRRRLRRRRNKRKLTPLICMI